MVLGVQMIRLVVGWTRTETMIKIFLKVSSR